MKRKIIVCLLAGTSGGLFGYFNWINKIPQTMVNGVLSLIIFIIFGLAVLFTNEE